MTNPRVRRHGAVPDHGGRVGPVHESRRHTTRLVQGSDQRNDAISRGLRQRRTGTQPLTREARVETFLKQREDGTGPVTTAK